MRLYLRLSHAINNRLKRDKLAIGGGGLEAEELHQLAAVGIIIEGTPFEGLAEFLVDGEVFVDEFLWLVIVLVILVFVVLVLVRSQNQKQIENAKRRKEALQSDPTRAPNSAKNIRGAKLIRSRLGF